MAQQLKDIMTKQTHCLSPESTLQEASNEMRENDFGFLPLQEKGKLVGVVTDRDIIVKGIAKGLSPKSHLKEVMTKDVCTTHENEDINAAAKLMEEKQIRRLVVLDKDDKITGVISLGDIATKCHETHMSGEIIQCISEETH